MYKDQSDKDPKDNSDIVEKCQQSLPINRETFLIQEIETDCDLSAFLQENLKSSLGKQGVPAVYRSDSDKIVIYKPLEDSESQSLRHEWAHAYSGDKMYSCWCLEGADQTEGIFWAEAFAEYFSINYGEDIKLSGKVVNIEGINVPQEFVKYKKDGTIFYSGLAAYSLHRLISSSDIDWKLLKEVASYDKDAFKEWKCKIENLDFNLFKDIAFLYERYGMSTELYVQGMKRVLEKESKKA